ncbi:MAG: helix-turn-helix transcriptional regulator [Beijerinckiaceae bacterium]
MSRAERLLDLIQLLRRHRQPVSGSVLAGELGVSLRSVYRDIDTLRGQGAPIDGEAGVGYVLQPGFMLPPLMFSEEEMEALMMGASLVRARADGALARAAENAMVKITAVLPDDVRQSLQPTSWTVPSGEIERSGDDHLPAIRDAIRRERKITIHYRDMNGVESSRTAWPFLLAFFERVRVVVAWCELRKDFRTFRADRIIVLNAGQERYPRRRHALRKEWRTRDMVACPSA